MFSRHDRFGGFSGGSSYGRSFGGRNSSGLLPTPSLQYDLAKRARVEQYSRSSYDTTRLLEERIREENQLRRLAELDQIKKDRELSFLRHAVDIDRRNIAMVLERRDFGRRGGREFRRGDTRRFGGVHDRETRRDKLRRDTERKNFDRSRTSQSKLPERRRRDKKVCKICDYYGKGEDDLKEHEESEKHKKVISQFQTFSEKSGKSLQEIIDAFLEMKQRKRGTEPEVKSEEEESEEESFSGFYKSSGRWKLSNYDATKSIGQDFITPASGYYCKLCHRFYYSESSALTSHCKTRSHYENLNNWLRRFGEKYTPGKYAEFLENEEKETNERLKLREEREMKSSPTKEIEGEMDANENKETDTGKTDEVQEISQEDEPDNPPQSGDAEESQQNGDNEEPVEEVEAIQDSEMAEQVVEEMFGDAHEDIDSSQQAESDEKIKSENEDMMMMFSTVTDMLAEPTDNTEEKMSETAIVEETEVTNENVSEVEPETVVLEPETDEAKVEPKKEVTKASPRRGRGRGRRSVKK